MRTGRGAASVLAILVLAASAPAALAGGKTERVSVGSAGQQADDQSLSPAISGGGRFVVFDSLATNLVGGDANGFMDVFLRDRQAGTTTLVSVSSAGAQGNSGSYGGAVTRAGRYVAFGSDATNLAPNVPPGLGQAYRRDVTGHATVLVSVAAGGGAANGSSYPWSISGDGRYVVFQSTAADIVPGAGADGEHAQTYVRDMAAGTTTLESATPGGKAGGGNSTQGSITPDGRWLAFLSDAPDLVTGGTNGRWNAYLRDRQAKKTVLLSVAADGGPANDGVVQDGVPVPISDEGRFVAFSSDATNLVTGDTNDSDDVFVRDVQTGKTVRVSVASDGRQGDGPSDGPSLSADGRYVAFNSSASNLVAGDTNRHLDVFVRDLTTGTTIRADVQGGGKQARVGGDYPQLSANGRFVAFESGSPNLVAGDTNGTVDVFVRRLLPASP